MTASALQRAVFLLLLAAITVAFFWVLAPYSGAVFWAIIMALLFHSTFERLTRALRGRRNAAALLTLLIIVLIVVLPMVFISISLVNEVSALVAHVRAGDINFRAYAQQILDALPPAVRAQMARFDLFDIQSVIEKFSDGLLAGGQALTTRALSLGQNALVFVVNLVVMLYLLFFLLRDGSALARMVRETVPMAREQTHYLADKFSAVARATVKGNVVVAIVQGLLGGLAFWVLDIRGALLWGVVMAFLSLLPAVGASLVWGPVAIYLLAIGATWQGVALIAWGTAVIGMSDNVLRPLLVGKDTKLPDYLVLLTTLGGMSLFGISGFVIGPTIAALFMAAWALFRHAGRRELREEAAAAAERAPQTLQALEAAPAPAPEAPSASEVVASDVAEAPEAAAPPAPSDTPQ
ncbi:MAG: AI-2E family transporter [Ottowia sp.]|nr:AI-2E family transporter [Ottowia sp.]MBQ9579451.1 AI-2E family transporter [Ottowia sp.]